MQWFKQAVDFLKLATEDEEKRKYESQLFQIKNFGYDPNTVNSFIYQWGDKPFFSWEEMQELFDEHVAQWVRTVGSFYNRYVYITDGIATNKNMPDALKKKWINDFTNAYLEAKVDAGIGPQGITTGDYLQMEKLFHLLAPEVRNKAIQVMLLNLNLRLYQMLHEYETKDEEDEKAIDRRNSGTIQTFTILYQASMYLPKEELKKAVKQMGPEDYARVLRGTNEDKSLHQILSQSEISEWDVSLILKNKETFLVGEEFYKIIEKATPAAKDYLRRFLYFAYSGNRYFILDEEMKPMSYDYKTIDHPISSVFVTRLSQMEPHIQAIWGPIFAEFKMMSY